MGKILFWERNEKRPPPRRTKEKLLSNIISRKGVEEK